MFPYFHPLAHPFFFPDVVTPCIMARGDPAKKMVMFRCDCKVYTFRIPTHQVKFNARTWQGLHPPKVPQRAFPNSRLYHGDRRTLFPCQQRPVLYLQMSCLWARALRLPLSTDLPMTLTYQLDVLRHSPLHVHSYLYVSIVGRHFIYSRTMLD